jgi:hypothetical protein
MSEPSERLSPSTDSPSYGDCEGPSMMRLGNPDIVGDDQRLLGHKEVSYARVSLV